MSSKLPIVCHHCGATTEKRIGAINRARANGARLYCNITCAHLAQRSVFSTKGYVGSAIFVSPFDDCPPQAEWRVVAEYPAYSVSEYGHLMRVAAGINTRVGRILAPYTNYKGYPCYSITMGSHALKKCWRAHRLVALAFIGDPPPGKPFALHNDGIKSHCHHSNIRWGSEFDNQADRKIHEQQGDPLWAR